MYVTNIRNRENGQNAQAVPFVWSMRGTHSSHLGTKLYSDDILLSSNRLFSISSTQFFWKMCQSWTFFIFFFRNCYIHPLSRSFVTYTLHPELHLHIHPLSRTSLTHTPFIQNFNDTCTLHRKSTDTTSFMKILKKWQILD